MSNGHPHGPGAHDHLHGDAGEASPADPCGHAHDAEHQRRAHGAGTSLRRLGVSLSLTAAVMIAEAVGGILSGSLALVSDAGHMLTDAGALGIAAVAAYLATRPADDKRTFGFRRVEVRGPEPLERTVDLGARWKDCE